MMHMKNTQVKEMCEQKTNWSYIFY